MQQGDRLWRTGSLTLIPSGHGRDYAVEIQDHTGTPLATCDAEGVVRDHAGAVLVSAPVRRPGLRGRPTDVAVELSDGQGARLGTARVVSYRVGPRARKVTVAILDAEHTEAARLEPVDARGDQLAAVAGGAQVATVAIAQVKRGFLRKARIYTVDIAAEVAPGLRPLLLGVVIRYDAVLDAVLMASGPD